LRRLYTAQITKFNLENWIPSLKEGWTPKSEFIKLNDDELKLIQALNAENLGNSIGMPRRLSNAELEQREKLEEKLDKFFVGGKGFFCRLSTRSPKDAVSLSPEEKQLPINERLKRKIDKLRVKSGDDVLNLIGKSQRVFSDISFYFQYRVKDSSSETLFIILREFIEIQPDHEFRCYVKSKKLLAISQYQCYCKFERLQEISYVSKLKQSILDFHDETKNQLPMPDYVIDVFVNPETFKCTIIELNPMGASMSSGSALFNWNTDFDLLDGKKEDRTPMRILYKLIDVQKEEKMQ